MSKQPQNLLKRVTCPFILFQLNLFYLVFYFIAQGAILQFSYASNYKLQQRVLFIYFNCYHMGVSLSQISQAGASFPSKTQLQQGYIIKSMTTHSPEHHRSLIAQIGKAKQFQCERLVKLIDSHSVQSYNLCSTLSQVYVLFGKPTSTLTQYVEKMEGQKKNQKKCIFGGVLKAVCQVSEFLHQEGIDMNFISEDMIYVDQAQGQSFVQIMNPYFIYDEASWQQDQTIEAQLAQILFKYFSKEISPEQNDLLQKMSEGKLTLKQFSQSQPTTDHKKSRGGLKLVKNYQAKADIPHIKITRQSNVSNTSSLLIDGGDVSDMQFRHFYQHFDDISQISAENTTYILNDTLGEQETSHQFPRRYLKGKGFKKINRTITSMEYEHMNSERTLKHSEGYTMTRDHSQKQNLRMDLKPFVLQSTKMMQSYAQGHHQ